MLWKRKLLEIPLIGIINRHNALLPKNRGRLTPFWVLYREEEETGVSIHFIDEGIDSGDIIVQKKFPVSKTETFDTLVKKNYQVAYVAMLEAIKKLDNNERDFLPNDDKFATYNTTPSLKDAYKFRKKILINFFKYFFQWLRFSINISEQKSINFARHHNDSLCRLIKNFKIYNLIDLKIGATKKNAPRRIRQFR